ncbi:MAG: hypothetical protein E7620_06130, partial [Ruminococcaceae bacterium]|nr:hypothetical protein [Oscillospiraceae bacterium]
MNFLERLREENPAVRFLIRAQSTVYYPILFAALCVCSGLGNRWVYLPILWLLTATVVFSALFSTDNKPLLVPIMLAYYALGSDAETTVYNDTALGYLQSFHIGAFVQICICGVIMASALIYRLARDGSLKRAFQKRGLCASGFLAIGVTFLLNGAFSGR